MARGSPWWALPNFMRPVGLALPDFPDFLNIKTADDNKACIKFVEAKHVHASCEEFLTTFIRKIYLN